MQAGERILCENRTEKDQAHRAGNFSFLPGALSIFWAFLFYGVYVERRIVFRASRSWQGRENCSVRRDVCRMDRHAVREG